MRLRRVSMVLPFALLLANSAMAQDFDPRGRHRPPARSNATQSTRPHPSAPTVNGTSPAVLIERYSSVVLSQPGAPFPLQRLAQLYRDRDGKLDALIADLRLRAERPGHEQYAAGVALAGVYKLDGRADEAIQAYESATAKNPSDPAALLALAQLLTDRGDVVRARARFEQALALQSVRADRSQTLHSLQTLALDAKDWEAAGQFHAELLRLEPNSLFVRGELGRELYARGEYERAENEFKGVVKAAAGDNRALAPALADLGQAEAKAHKSSEAIATLKQALSVAGAAAAVRSQIYQTLTEVYRADQSLPTLIKELEGEHPGDYARLALLGSLYEETGDAVRALAAYRRALAVEPRQIDLRLKMIRLLQAEGELEQAILAYEGIIRAAPNNPQFVFEMCEALIQRGDRTRALRLLGELEARGASDEDVMNRLGEFYSRIGEADRAVRVLSRLAEIGGNDPSHLADLGDHFFQAGKTASAVATWKRILTTVTPRARALAALGDVYLEHEMLSEALVSLREAVELDPSNASYKKDLASALERSRAYREASVLWEGLAEKAKQSNDRALLREVRTHVVTLWTLEQSLERKAPELETAFAHDPPDVEAGRTLAELQLRLRRIAASEQTLRRVIQLAPGDAESYLALERVLVQEGKLDDAISVLSQLVQVDPKRARETYQRMAQYALQGYKDEDAIKYAARAVELNPDDAEGHRRLGDMYRARQDREHAIVEYRAAIAKNERLFLVYFELADLLLSKGETEEADRLFRRVLRAAPDEELVARAARMSMQIHLGNGTLASLEQDLVPLAIGNPQKPLYRRLLVEMYGNLSFGLVQRARHGGGKDAEEASAALAKLGQRAVKPLLDALADNDGGQQRVALDVLGYVANKNTGPPLFSFATSGADAPLRERAMVACGALRDPGLLPRYQAYLFPKGLGTTAPIPTDPVAVAAVWGVARMKDMAAAPVLRALVRGATPEIRALAVLGLGALGDKASMPLIVNLVHELDAGDLARAAAAYALGLLDAEAAVPVLVTLAEDGDPLPREMALLALARTEASRGTVRGPTALVALSAMAAAVFEGGDAESARARSIGESLHRAGAAALIMMVPGTPASRSTFTNHDPFPVPEGPIQVEAILTALVPDQFSDVARAAVLVSYGDILQRAAETALETSGERARAVLLALSGGNASLEPFLSPEAAPATDAARARAKKLVQSIEPTIAALVRHPDSRLRASALSLLSRSDSDAAVAALIEATEDKDEMVARNALAVLGTRPSHRVPRAREVLARILASDTDWSRRVLAADALGRLGRPSSVDGPSSPPDALLRAAETDPYALVREAALRALATVDPSHALLVERRIEETDAEPKVRETAHRLESQASAPTDHP